ncbi:MAG: hypothetical protein KBD21_00035 [Candidatus Pacebacteria bacterium]|nr:hypothetical protein [Candidatus Paceibacterota bacterium]
METPEQTFTTQMHTNAVGQQTVQQPFVSSAQEDEERQYGRPGWSWGGFMFHVYFAACVRRYGYLAWLVVFLIPLLSIPVVLGLMFYFGVKGREIAASSPLFKNKQQYIGFMKGIDRAGKVLFFLMFVVLGGIALVGVFASIMLASLSSQREAAWEASVTNTARSIVPLMTLCRDAGGSVESPAPQVGDFICSETSFIEDNTYPALPKGWEYGSAEDGPELEFSFSIFNTENGATYACSVQGCVWESDVSNSF